MKGDGNDHKVAEQMSETETPWNSATDADMPLVERALPSAAYTTVILSHNQCEHRCGDIRCPAAAVTKQQTKQTNYRRVLHLMHACMWWSGGGWIYSHMDVTFKKKSLKAAFQKLSVALLAWFCTHCMTQWHDPSKETTPYFPHHPGTGIAQGLSRATLWATSCCYV